MSEDKKTIGLTDQAKATMDRVVATSGFKRDMDAAKFAFAFAIEKGCEPAAVEGTGTIWNVGTLDEGGELKTLVENLFPAVQEPYGALEALMNQGFSLLEAEMAASSGLRVEEIIKRCTTSV